MNYNLSAGLSSRNTDKSVQKKRSQNIQVVVRCRPLNASEKKNGAVSIVDVVPEKKEIHVREKILPVGLSKSFAFDRVFGSSSKQIELYKTVVLPILKEVLEGYNCTIFAYGQTGTGKTFTMEGERSDDPSISWEDDPLAGIIPRVMNQLFTELQERGNDYTVYVSYLEIYNEELTDLLNPNPSDNQKLNIYEDSNKKGACIISGLTEMIVNNKDEVYQILQSGTARRKTATTLMNAHSSRSHTLFMVTIKTKENSLKEFVKIGKFNLVDLAGSECIGRSGAQDKTAREAGSINQSLLALGRVITTLVEHKTHVPYRESKLTRLLQDSLGGRTKTSIIATISPASSNLEETLSTLDYAYRARNITNKPEINQKLSEETLVKEYAEEIQKLHRDLKAAREKNGVFLTEETYNGMILEGRDLKERNGMLTQENTEVKEALEECKSNLETTSEKLTSTTSDLLKTREELNVTKKELEDTRYKKMELQYIGQSDLQVHEMLSDQANKVLLAANDAVSDTHGLHVKLDRLRSVESNNNIAKDGFKSDFDLWVNDLRSKVRDKTAEQTMYMNAVHEGFESSVEKVRDFTSHKLSLLVDKVREDVSGLEHAHIRHEHGMNKTIDSMRASVAAAVQEDSDRTSNFQNQVVALLTSKMKVAMDCALQGFKDLKDVLTQQRAVNISHLERFQSNHQATINQSIAAVEKLNRGQADVVGKMKKRSEMMWIARAKFEAEILDKMREMSSKMVEMQEDIMNGVVEGEEERINNYQHCKSVEEKLVGELNEVIPLMTSQHDTHLETNLTYINTTSAEVENLNCVQQINEDIDLFCSESLEACKNHSELMEDYAEQARNQTEASMKGFAIKTKDLGSLVEEGVDEIRNDQAENSEQLEKVFRSEQDGLVRNSTGFGSWNEELQKNFEAGVVHVGCFLHEKLVDDNPTGSTPKRKHFEYPQDLTKRRKLNDLRAEFKTKFFTNEASDLPLPHGDDDDDEDELMERSTESLDSLASSQQSTCSKVKNKENIIPPPQASTVRKEIRRPKVESSNIGKVKGRGK